VTHFKRNDLAQVIRWPCCGAAMDAIFLVDKVITTRVGIKCDNCGRHFFGPHVLVSNGCRGVVPIGWVRRYKALDELEGAQRVTSAPAA